MKISSMWRTGHLKEYCWISKSSFEVFDNKRNAGKKTFYLLSTMMLAGGLIPSCVRALTGTWWVNFKRLTAKFSNVSNVGQSKDFTRYYHCPACRTSLIATRFWVVMICPIIKCLTVLEFSFILFDLCLYIPIFNFILNYVPIVTFWILTYHKIWILLIIFCFIWSYWIIYFLTCLEVFWSVVS